METGCLYFIIDDFYNKFDPDKVLMQNKETLNGQVHSRPCFFAFQDKENDEIYWLVPISSKVEKFETIVQNKIDKMKSNGKNNPQCNTIRFGEVMGHKRAFLIQNMFPVTYKYINCPYIDKNTNKNVTLKPEITKDIIKNAKEVLKLYKRGIKLIYGDMDKIYTALSNELTIEKENKLSELCHILEEKDKILNDNQELKAMYKKAEEKYLLTEQKSQPIDKNASLTEQINAALILRNECNQILNSDPLLKKKYIEAKNLYCQEHREPVLTATKQTKIFSQGLDDFAKRVHSENAQKKSSSIAPPKPKSPKH